MEGVVKDAMVLWVLAEEYSTWIFLGDDFWIYFRVQLFPWFDSGYMLRQSTAAFVCVLFVFSVMLGSTLDTDATAAVVSTCSASADCTDSATPMCSAGACVALSCDGGSFTPGGAVHGVTG